MQHCSIFGKEQQEKLLSTQHFIVQTSIPFTILQHELHSPPAFMQSTQQPQEHAQHLSILFDTQQENLESTQHFITQTSTPFSILQHKLVSEQPLSMQSEQQPQEQGQHFSFFDTFGKTQQVKPLSTQHFIVQTSIPFSILQHALPSQQVLSMQSEQQLQGQGQQFFPGAQVHFSTHLQSLFAQQLFLFSIS